MLLSNSRSLCFCLPSSHAYQYLCLSIKSATRKLITAVNEERAGERDGERVSGRDGTGEIWRENGGFLIWKQRLRDYRGEMGKKRDIRNILKSKTERRRNGRYRKRALILSPLFKVLATSYVSADPLYKSYTGKRGIMEQLFHSIS